MNVSVKKFTTIIMTMIDTSIVTFKSKTEVTQQLYPDLSSCWREYVPCTGLGSFQCRNNE